jgi:hypothetical protein
MPSRLDRSATLQDSKLGIRDGLATLVLIGLALFSPPLFVIERYSLYSINKLAIAVLTAGLAVLLVRRLAIASTAAHLTVIAFVQAALLLALPFAHQAFGYEFDSGYFNVAFQVLAATAIFVILASSQTVRLFASFWVNLHLVIGALGLLVFIGGLTINLQPLGTFSDRPYYDFGLAYSNVFYQVGGLNLIRIAGFYDEPGTFAFYITSALILGRLFDLPRWKELALLAFGLTTLSMAFFIVAIFWLTLTLNRRRVLYLLAAVGILSMGITQIDPEMREQLAHVTVDRFSVSEADERLVRGDNRTAIMRENFVAFMDAPFFGHGLHYQYHVDHLYHNSFIANPVAPFATHGLFGAIVFNFHVLILFLTLLTTNRLGRRNQALVLVVLLLTLAQRPTTINGLGYLLFIIMIYGVIEYPRRLGYWCREVLATQTESPRGQ